MSVSQGRERYRSLAARAEHPSAVDVVTSGVRRGAARWAARRGNEEAGAALAEGERSSAGLRRATETDQAMRRGLAAVGLLEAHELAEMHQRGLDAVERVYGGDQ